MANNKDSTGRTSSGKTTSAPERGTGRTSSGKTTSAPERGGFGPPRQPGTFYGGGNWTPVDESNRRSGIKRY